VALELRAQHRGARWPAGTWSDGPQQITATDPDNNDTGLYGRAAWTVPIGEPATHEDRNSTVTGEVPRRLRGANVHITAANTEDQVDERFVLQGNP
jgi:hypothetical protein